MEQHTDKTWITKDRDTLDYEIGVEKFLIYAEENCQDRKSIPCPCARCGNFKKFSAKIIRGHLYENGFSLGYVDWVWHGESTRSSIGSAPLPAAASEANNICEAAYNSGEGDDYDKDSYDFKRFVADAQQPLYEGSDSTKLDSMLKMNNWKARFGISDSAFTDLLSTVGSFLPPDHVLPKNAYEAKKTLSNLGLEYIKFHACPNECILYRGVNENDSECPKCKFSRWKLSRDGKVRVNIPAKVMWYFPIIPRFKRMFKSASTAQLLTWHSDQRIQDGQMRHPPDSPSWRNVDYKWPAFGTEPRNLRLALSTALQQPERSGRVRGVGSFVTPTVYFNIPPGKRNRITKDELLARDKKREEDFEKRTLEFDQKTENLMLEIAELKAMIGASNHHSPILSDKASCRGEKEQQIEKAKPKPAAAKELMGDVVFDPPPQDKKVPRKCELAVDTIDNKVAFGLVFNDEDMAKTVHGVPLEPDHVRVSVDGIFNPDALVPVPIPGEIEMVHQALGSHLAWPRNMIIYPPNNVPTERKRKEKAPKGELQRVQALFTKVKLNENVPERYKLLYKHASCFMKETGTSIQIRCDLDLFGIERTIFLLHENIIALSEFAMIGQAIISTYMAYLHTNIILGRNSDIMYTFLDPSVHKINQEFEAYVVKRMNDGVHFMPYNQKQGMHWILVVIWESEIFILNPLSHVSRFLELEKALTGAVRTYNAQKGRVNKNPKVINLSGCPKQPGATECGYVIMRYMKQIIEDQDMKILKLWANKSRKFYEKKDLDIVRMEILGYIEEFM